MTSKSTAFDQNVMIGIDFGTTKTMVAVYDGQKGLPRTLSIGRGKFEMPTSMYDLETSDWLFGDEADDEGITDASNYARRFKRDLGKPTLAHRGRKPATAKELTANFMGNLKSHLENHVLHAPVSRVVMTIPAKFGPAQQQDLTVAARQAGFSDVELLTEPEAAGIAYCEQQSDLAKPLRFIVVDWGGGTFDVAYVQKTISGEVEIHKDFVVGLDHIGGEVFDDKLWEFVSKESASNGYGTLESKPKEDWGRYRRDISRAKEQLSAKASVVICKVTVSRTDFNTIISSMLREATNCVGQLMKRAKDAGYPTDFILLAGGTSKVPLIREELERATSLKCRQWNEGREAVALGAAIRANHRWGQQSATDGEISTSVKIFKVTFEALNIDGKIDDTERVFLEKKRKELGISLEDARLIYEGVDRPTDRPTIKKTKMESHVNGLGMKFVTAGTNGVLFGVWETRVKDFRSFVSATGYDAIKNAPNGAPAYTLEKEGEEVKWKQAGGSWEDPRFPIGHKQNENHPVVCVSYLDAEAFCEWLTKKERDGGKLPEGWRYRLPTDEEWSAACGPEEYPWGANDQPGNRDGNYSGVEAMVGSLKGETNEFSRAGRNDRWARTAPVGSFGANMYGLYDMGGNVWEWCSTWYKSTMNDAETLAAVPSFKEDGGGKTSRVVRGGSWRNGGRVLTRSAFRYGGDPRGRDDGIGFRVVLVGAGG
jgi:formylglycine-generating enzyme required for sulfatase activity/actin-like ATPase involved in cell morphogenesis